MLAVLLSVARGGFLLPFADKLLSRSSLLYFSETTYLLTANLSPLLLSILDELKAVGVIL
jgi:hypothetical protein